MWLGEAMPRVWGIHNDRLTTELYEQGFVSIGWGPLGDLSQIGPTREDLKSALLRAFPTRKQQAIASNAGVLERFRSVIAVGDVVVAPYRPDSTIAIGVVTGSYYFDPSADTHPNRLPVEWKRTGVPRSVFSQSALYEVGSALTLFEIKNHSSEFLALLDQPSGSVDADESAVERAVASADAEPSAEPRASRVERHTRDFVLAALKDEISHQEFEEFTAALLRAVGYQARTTTYSGDGGIDVLAHRDPLGVEPPQIKVQCKHQTSNVGGPEVQQLMGAQGAGELLLFVTLGGYTQQARDYERSKPGLRLLTGEDIVDLFLSHYGELEPRWRSLVPLRPVLVVDDTADN